MIDTAVLRKLLADTTQGEWIYGGQMVIMDLDNNCTWDPHLYTHAAWNHCHDAEFIVAAHNTMLELLDELDRLRAFVAEHGIAMDTAFGSTHRHICRECGAMGDAPHADPIEHAPGCIVAEARQKKEARG